MAQKKPIDRAKRQARIVAAYKSVFSGNDGETVLLDLMKAHHFDKSTFPVSGSVNEMIFREGERNVLLRIFKILKLDANAIKERIESHENEME